MSEKNTKRREIKKKKIWNENVSTNIVILFAAVKTISINVFLGISKIFLL